MRSHYLLVNAEDIRNSRIPLLQTPATYDLTARWQHWTGVLVGFRAHTQQQQNPELPDVRTLLSCNIRLFLTEEKKI